MSKIPVIIPARNEAAFIGKTLESLPNYADPIVIPNGCTDETAQIAESFGATVLSTEIEGKMPAIQLAIDYLGKRALEPLITLDADSRPIFPKKWLEALLAARYTLSEEEPAIATGSVIFTGGVSAVSSIYRTVRSYQVYAANRTNLVSGPTVGANMLIHPVNDSTLERLRELPQIWPGEDAVIKDTIVTEGGSIRRSIDPRAMVFTDSARYKGLMYRLLTGKEQSWARIYESYMNDAPPGSISGSEYKGRTEEIQIAA